MLAEHRANLVSNVGAPMAQGPSPQGEAWQMDQQRQIALAQWQAQQVQPAQLDELTKQGAAGRGGAQPGQGAQGQLGDANTAAINNVEVLTRLAALRDQGVLTEQEFASEKAKVLGTEATPDHSAADVTTENPPPPMVP